MKMKSSKSKTVVSARNWRRILGEQKYVPPTQCQSPRLSREEKKKHSGSTALGAG